MTSVATSTGATGQPYGGSIAASIYDRAQTGLVNLANRYADNEALSGVAVGKLADSYGTSLNTAAQIEYDNAFLGSLTKYQQATENLRKGNTLELLAAETGSKKELMSIQGELTKDQLMTQGDQARRGQVTGGEQDRLGVAARGVEDRAGYRVQGEEGRLTQDNAADNTIRLREQAKGSIRQQGQRYYG
jgi:hypothetical protein